MPRRRVRERARLAPTLGVSLLLHLAVAVPLILARPEGAPALPPIYRVDLIAAPAGPRQAGIVTPQPQAQPEQPAPTPVEAVETKADKPGPALGSTIPEGESLFDTGEPEAETTVVDLMSALKASVEKAKKGESARGRESRGGHESLAAAKKTTAREKSARKKAA